MYKEGKWAKQILAIQQEDGKWGWFHSLGQLSGASLTTEQALGRLEILGYTRDDACIQKALQYMHRCLAGEIRIPDREEKVQDWPVFCRMILAARIRRFTKEDSLANQVASEWTKVIEAAFAKGTFCAESYEKAYCDMFNTNKRKGRIIHYANYYPVSLLADELDSNTESAFLDDLLQQPNGIYYVYERCINTPPEVFQSKQTNRYLTALELLGRYSGAKQKLQFAVHWIMENRMENGMWDLGQTVNDKTVFPLSDDWRTKEKRQKDCTEQIKTILNQLA